MFSECSAVYLPYVNVAKHGHLPLTPSLPLLLSVYRWLQVNGSRGYRCVCGRAAGAVGGGRRGRLQWKQTIKWTRVRIHLTCLNSFSQTRSIFFCSPESFFGHDKREAGILKQQQQQTGINLRHILTSCRGKELHPASNR